MAPRRTRQTKEGAETTNELVDLIRELRTKLGRQRMEFDEERRQNEEFRREVTARNPRHSEESNNQQSQHFNLLNNRPNISNSCSNSNLGYIIKPDNYDGSTPLKEFYTQFEFVARANNWDEAAKVLALASSLRGKARAILGSCRDPLNLSYNELKSNLELHFGQRLTTQNSYTEFSNRRQKEGEDLSTLASDLDRLVRIAYPESSIEVQDKIACAQFINAIRDPHIREILQLEGIRSLKQAIIRAMEVRDIKLRFSDFK